MKLCPKCKTVALGNNIMLCPECGETFPNYKTMKANLQLGKL